MLDDLKITITLSFLHQVFTFNAVQIRVHPSVKVKNGAPMSIICHADISKSTNFNLQHNITIFKDDKPVFRSVSDKEDARYEVPKARSSHTGDYQCVVEADGKRKKSDSLHVWVTGMTKPILIAEKNEVFEGEAVKLRCELPEEEPPLRFIFRKIKMNSSPKEKDKRELERNFSVIEFPVDEGDNILHFDCFGTRSVKDEFETSEPSNRTLVTVKELFPKPVLVASANKLDENKELTLSCSIKGFQNASFSILRKNSHGEESLLKNSRNLTMRANVRDTGSYICKAEVNRIVKESKPVTVRVYVPIRNTSLGSFPYGEVEDGSEITFLCSVMEGSWPVLFRLFRKSDRDVLLFENSEHANRVMWRKEDMSREDTGTYYCIASNRANVSAKSHPITINAKGPSMEMSRSALSTNSTSEKLSRQHNDGDYYSGSGYIEDGENHMKSTDENKGPDLESAEVEYTEVEVSTLDPHRGK
ncbi:UNVERIFIED_CONTAM: hypothetical protein H355_014866 [Colinus virginianus]|nr:hypothetical protein H355_014866 [Colinus virginianus]